MITAGAAGVGIVVVFCITSEILVHVVVHGALVQVVEPVIGAIKVAVDVATVQRGVAHDHFHVTDPAIANVEGIARAVGSV